MENFLFEDMSSIALNIKTEEIEEQTDSLIENEKQLLLDLG